ncbi:hypothetical protein Tco_0357493 [Tanacetum coccineum]
MVTSAATLQWARRLRAIALHNGGNKNHDLHSIASPQIPSPQLADKTLRRNGPRRSGSLGHGAVITAYANPAKKFLREPKERRGLSNKGINMLHIIFRGDRSSSFTILEPDNHLNRSVAEEPQTHQLRKLIFPNSSRILNFGIEATDIGTLCA